MRFGTVRKEMLKVVVVFIGSVVGDNVISHVRTIDTLLIFRFSERVVVLVITDSLRLIIVDLSIDISI